MYHASIAVGHFARQLAAESPGSRNEYQVVAVLQALWLTAPNPLAESPRVVVAFDDLAGLVSSRPRFRQVLARLKQIGALDRADVGYVLHKPAVERLDAYARQQVEAATRLVGSETRAKPAAQVVAASVEDQRERAEAKRESADRRRDVLAAIDKQASDIRNALASMACVPPSSLRYSGKGSGATFEAVEWLANTGATWREFLLVCKAAKQDTSPDKPTDIEYLFALRNADYLNRLLEAAKKA